MTLKGRKILIGITGSIAAYKIPLLIRLLKKAGAEVKVIMTEAAVDFVTPLTVSTVSGYPVYIDPYDKRTGNWNSHIELAGWADLFLIAPVSANTLAKMANGIADNLLMTTYLAARCPVFFAPAMDLDMFNHPATQKNIEVIRTFGHCLIESREGELASGLTGPGRMEEPERIFEIIHEYFYSEARFENFNVLITAGPTYENIDPVRFLGNYSSGKMGFAIAKAMSENGAMVTLISGPVHLATPAGSIKRIDVISSEEMYEACMKEADNSDIIIMAAAVADFRVENYQGSKIKKSGDTFSLKFVQTPDILRSLGQRKKHEQIIVGFALETDNELDNAKAKLQNKNIDIIVLNSLRHKGAGFATDTNKITILDRNETIREYEMKSKSKVADDIVAYISDFLKQKK